jgi:hypothetical protein
MINKTLFDAVEGELRNARLAINNAGAYMNMLKNGTELNGCRRNGKNRKRKI